MELLRHDDDAGDYQACRAIAISFTQRYGLRIDANELLGEVWEYVQLARSRFDPERGVKFHTFATTVAYRKLIDTHFRGRAARPRPGTILDEPAVAAPDLKRVDDRDAVRAIRLRVEESWMPMIDGIMRGMTRSEAVLLTGRTSKGHASNKCRELRGAFARVCGA